jgi:hypothetical protein
MTRLRAFWNTEWAGKWGRLLVFLAVIELVWLWFTLEHTMTRTDQKWIVTITVPSCIVALLASALTTRKYSLRGLGVFGLFLGLGFLCGWFMLRYWEKPSPSWLIDQTAAALIIGAPALVIGTVLAIVQRLRGEPTNGGTG